MVIALSARLNTGQILKSKKSITKPTVILSIKLPKAPAKMSERERRYILEARFDVKRKKIIMRQARLENIVKRCARFLNKPNAVPGFLTRVI